MTIEQLDITTILDSAQNDKRLKRYDAVPFEIVCAWFYIFSNILNSHEVYQCDYYTIAKQKLVTVRNDSDEKNSVQVVKPRLLAFRQILEAFYGETIQIIVDEDTREKFVKISTQDAVTIYNAIKSYQKQEITRVRQNFSPKTGV